MNMRLAAGVFKKTAHKHFLSLKHQAADRANPIPLSPQAVNTAFDMHEPVFPAGQ
jgi:hypothetical protein